MQLGRIWLCASLVICAGIGVLAQSKTTKSDLVVHEWGTFLSMSGSDGATLEGMYHEEHALPPFVHARSRDQLRLRSMMLKGETPVIYFYTDQAQKVQVTARFPRGLWTQWYPQAQVVGPQLAATAAPLEARDGHITWCADVIPARDVPSPTPPAAAKGALWNFARDVDAAYVRTVDRTRKPATPESDRFLFYRGLGRAPLPLRLTTSDSQTLSLDCDDPRGAQHIFILHVEGGRGSYTYLPDIRRGAPLTVPVPSLEGAQPLAEFTRRLGDDLAARLVDCGLYPKEARAMVNTWKTSYFQTEGVRALFVLPRATTDALIPLTISPEPKELVRVMVGRIEVLTPERERAAEKAVRDLASTGGAVRRSAYDLLRGQGRYVEPILRRVLETTSDATVRAHCQRLLLTDFVTELKAAVHAPSNGARIVDDPTHLRAQLASLLREVGLVAEARAEGAAAASALQSQPEPPIERPEARGYLRAFARAAEGMGDDRKAASGYERFIRFGSQVGTRRDCIGCHNPEGPRELSWYRDWWAGRKYAQALTRAGLADEAVAGHEKALAGHPGDIASRMMLAYLYESRGESAKAQTLWESLTKTGQGEGNAE